MTPWQVPACDRCLNGVMDATNSHLAGTCRCPCHLAQLRRRLELNGAQIDSWLWRARHAIRRRQPRPAFEALLTACWLLGVETDADRRRRRIAWPAGSSSSGAPA